MSSRGEFDYEIAYYKQCKQMAKFTYLKKKIVALDEEYNTLINEATKKSSALLKKNISKIMGKVTKLHKEVEEQGNKSGVNSTQLIELRSLVTKLLPTKAMQNKPTKIDRLIMSALTPQHGTPGDAASSFVVSNSGGAGGGAGAGAYGSDY